MLQNYNIAGRYIVGWVKVAIYAPIILITYYTTLDWLIFRDWTREEYSHCIIIPFFVTYLLWRDREDIANAPSAQSYTGLLPIFFGIVLFWIGELGGEFSSMYLSLWLVIIGLVLANLGWQKFKVMAFPLIFLITTFPIPALINSKINFQLRLLSSTIGVKILHLFKVPAYRSGNIIELSFTKLQVVDACSGLKYTLSLMILALVFAYLTKTQLWKKILIFLSAFPLAILFNSLRVAVTAIIYELYGQKAAEGFFHGFTGWIVFAVAFVFLVLLMTILKRLPSRKKSNNREISDNNALFDDGKWNQSKFENNNLRKNKHISKKEIKQTLLAPIFLTTVVILLLSLTFSNAIDFKKSVPIIKPLSDFPLTVNKWHGKRSEFEAYLIEALDLSDYTLINYKDDSGKAINFYVSYYENQSKGKSTHSPETCLPGSGWEFKNDEVLKLTRNDDSSFLKVNRAYIEKSGEKQLVYFWFPMRGRILTNLFQVKIYNFLDALTKQRTDGALVRIMTPIYKHETRKEAENRLSSFVKKVEPLLSKYLPQ